MEIVDLITLILLSVNIIIEVVIFQKSNSTKEDDVEIDTRNDSTDKEQNLLFRRYKKFYSATELISLIIILSLILVFFFILKKDIVVSHKYIAITVSVICLLSYFYNMTNNFNVLMEIRNAFGKEENLYNTRVITMSDLFAVMELTAISFDMLLIVKVNTDNLPQMIYITTVFLNALILFVVIVVFIIQVRTVIIKGNVLTIIDGWIEHWEHAQLSLMPSFQYVLKHGGIKNKLVYCLFFIPDLIWHSIYFVLKIPVNGMISLYKIAGFFLRKIGSLVGICITDSNNMGNMKAYRELLGWCIILSLVLTFVIIIFSKNVSPQYVDLYSFVIGIVVIPVVLAKVISTNK